jgi:hypothetical protein
VITETPPEPPPEPPILTGWLPFDDDDDSTEITSPKINVLSSDSKELVVDMTVPGANVIDDAAEDGETYHQFNIQGSGYIAAPGKPKLPMLSRFIAIPKGADVTVEVVDSEFIEVVGYNISPAQEAATDQDNADSPPPEFELDTDIYETDAFFPADIAILDDHASIRGTTVAMLRVSPVQFNPVTQTLRVYSHVKVKVSFNDGDDDFIDDNLRNPSYDKMFRQLLLNAPVALASDDDAAFDANNSLLIITHPRFLKAANTLAAWKIKKGIHTTVTTTKQTGRTASKIKKYVQNAYKNANPPPTYLLLIGDAEFIPTNYVTTHPNSKHFNTKTGTDLYYVTVDGDDYFPDISMGRLSVDTLAQAKKRVADILSYEKASVKNTSFYKNATIAGYFQHDRNGFAARRFAQTSEDVAIHLSQANYSVDRIYFTEKNVKPKRWNGAGRWFGGGPAGNVGDLIPKYLRKPGFKWDGSADDITKAINSGRFLVVHRDHGRLWGWVEPHYEIDDVLTLNNANELPVVWSVNCRTGWFDNETDDKKLQTPSGDLHFSEAWERSPNGGAVGVIAATRISYSGYNDRLVWGWMDAIWPDFESSNSPTDPIFEMGSVLDYGKYYLATTYTADDKRKAEFEMFHWFGDPTMQIWTGVPKTLIISHNSTISEDATSIEVTVTVSDAVISISRAQPDNGTILGKAFSKGGATKIVLNSALKADEEIYVTVTKHNYRPYEATVKVQEVQPVDNDPCAAPTVTSDGNGGWTKTPSNTDVVKILAGHTVETDSVKAKTLCIESTGTLAGIPGTKLGIKLSLDEGVLHNQGMIRSAKGNDGDCPAGKDNASNYLHATNGMKIGIDVGTFINEGNIIAGNGGNDSAWKCLNDSSPGVWKYTFSEPAGREHKSNFGTWYQQDGHGETEFGFPSIGGMVVQWAFSPFLRLLIAD